MSSFLCSSTIYFTMSPTIAYIDHSHYSVSYQRHLENPRYWARVPTPDLRES